MMSTISTTSLPDEGSKPSEGCAVRVSFEMFRERDEGVACATTSAVGWGMAGIVAELSLEGARERQGKACELRSSPP